MNSEIVVLAVGLGAAAIITATTVVARALRTAADYVAASESVNAAGVETLRQTLNQALDDLSCADSTNSALRQNINQRDADLADAQAQLLRAADSIQGLIKALNAANVRCAELQNALHRHGLSAESAYFMAVLGDGSVAGPFSRN